MTDTNLDQFVQDAVRTESQIDKVRVNPSFFLGVIAISISIGNMLDQIKKHAFYNKEYDKDKLIEQFLDIVSGMDVLKAALQDGPAENEEELDVDPRLFHAIVGISTESTELLEALGDGNDIDLINLQEELGDINWYQAIAIDAIEDASFNNILVAVIEKLKERYPQKYTDDDAINRDLDNERDSLQKNLTTDE